MPLPRVPKAVIFDMDGLLVNTEEAYLIAMPLAAGAVGYEAAEADFRMLIGVPWHAGQDRLRERFGPDFPVDAFRVETDSRVEEALKATICLKAGVVELLDDLDRLGLPRGIATSSSHRAVQSHLGWSGILPRFHAVLADGDYARGKPAPDPYLAAAGALGVDPLDCVALEDSYNGVRAAHAAGMMTIMIPDLLDATDEMRGLCTHVLESLHAVRNLLRDAAT